MVAVPSQPEQVSVLASDADWAWPAALRDIFRPRGVDLLVAGSTRDFVNVIANKRIYATIIDMDSPRYNGLATIRIIRSEYPLMPCLLLKNRPNKALLDEALRLGVFSVIDKPVDMGILREQLDRLFVKRYGSNIFAR